MRPQISVIIPARNMELWIAETLASVLGLDYPPSLLDVVVVDDGSTDHTVLVARDALRNAPMKWLVHSTPCAGPSRARNLGARLARGRWLQFLDADDLLAPHKLKHQAPLAREAPATTAVIYSPWTPLDVRKGSWLPRAPMRDPVLSREPILALLQSENFIATGCQLFERGWFESVGGFDERQSYVEDVDLSLRLAMAGGHFAQAPSATPLFFYRQRATSLSRSDPVHFAKACARNARLAETHWRSQRKLTSEEKTALLETYGNALRTLFERDRAGFRELLAHVNRLEPRYCPAQPKTLRGLSKVIGYPLAETLALSWRRAKRALFPYRALPRTETNVLLRSL